eukprot:SAG31_NODE_11320_length_1042_cov_1.340403_1_plen_78_part_00
MKQAMLQAMCTHRPHARSFSTTKEISVGIIGCGQMGTASEFRPHVSILMCIAAALLHCSSSTALQQLYCIAAALLHA